MENYDHSPISHVRDAMRCDAMRCMNGKRRVQADAASVLGSINTVNIDNNKASGQKHALAIRNWNDTRRSDDSGHPYRGFSNV